MGATNYNSIKWWRVFSINSSVFNFALAFLIAAENIEFYQPRPGILCVDVHKTEGNRVVTGGVDAQAWQMRPSSIPSKQLPRKWIFTIYAHSFCTDQCWQCWTGGAFHDVCCTGGAFWCWERIDGAEVDGPCQEGDFSQSPCDQGQAVRVEQVWARLLMDPTG